MGSSGFRRRAALVSVVAVLAGTGGLAVAGSVASATSSARHGQQPARPSIAMPSGLLAAHRVAPRAGVIGLPANERAVCAQPTEPGQIQCQSVLLVPGRNPKSGARAFASPAFRVAGYGPSSLQSAYGLTAAAANRGRGETIGIVDAFNNPDLAKNLAAYRRHFGLPACTPRNGCLKIVNQAGRAGQLPRADVGWGIEESLDLQMVSAICPLCRIVLVEARSPQMIDLGPAEDTAVAKGARFVSNSWSGSEFFGQDFYNHFFNHPGDAIVFASGDNGYGALYPTDLQFVTAVGGTTLRHRSSGGRGWTESVWGSNQAFAHGTGSGCSTLEAKPSWQRQDNVAPAGCLNRTENDVAAVANPNTGVTVYDTFGTGGTWGVIGGTSAATPIITAVYALAGKPAQGTYPASYPYRRTGAFNDVTAGANGRCEPGRSYLCNAKQGYDGPTGLGTPRGTAGFSSRGAQGVTLLDPGTQDVGVSAGVKLTVRAVDSESARSLSYGATGLPPGLKITSVRGSLDGTISGRLPATAGSYHVTVTAKDRRTGRAGSTRFTFYVIGSLTVSAPAFGNVRQNDVAGSCLSTKGGATAPGTAVQIGPCSVATASNWAYVAGAHPGQAGRLRIAGGICLGLKRTNAVLQACGGASGQTWDYDLTYNAVGTPTSYLFNPASGRCLTGRGYGTGRSVGVAACSSTGFENWVLTNLSLRSGVAGQCGSFSGIPGQTARSAACAGTADQAFRIFGDKIAGLAGRCFDVHGLLANGVVIPQGCNRSRTAFSQQWLTGPAGALINANSGKCLDNPGGGQPLMQEDCYGLPGEIWAIN